MEKIPFVINDLVLFEEFCNLKCQYCEGFCPSEYKFQIKDGRLVLPESWKTKVAQLGLKDQIPENPNIDDLFDLGLEVARRTREVFDVTVLKLSGGEIFLNHHLIDFLRRIHSDYLAVQLLTNGTLFTERDIDLIAELENVYFQISLDHHNFERNRTRTDSPKLHQRVLRNICYIQERNLGLEINCVITRTNIGGLGEFLSYLNKGNTIIFPRPVRGKPKETLGAILEQLGTLKTILDNYDQYQEILPSRVYLEKVIELMESNQREQDCYVPFFVLGTNNYGQINTCTCSGELPLIGSVFNLEDRAREHLSEQKQYNPKSRLRPCKDCINQYGIFDLYVKGLISNDELVKIPTFQYPGVIERTKAIKNKLLKTNR